MEFTGVWKWTDLIGKWILSALILQGLWIVFTLLGGVIFGFWPATLTVCSIWRRIILNDEENISVFKTFIETYKKEFVRSNKLGLLLTGFGLFLYFDLQIVKTSINFYLLYIALIVLFIVYIGMMLFFFSVFVHFELSFKQYLKQSLLISLMRPFHTILMAIIILAISYLFIFIPLFIFFIGISMIVYPLIFVGIKVFNRLNNLEIESESANEQI